MIKAIRIVSCTDPLMWYARLDLGTVVEYINQDDMYYWSRDAGGYKNIIHKKDGVVVDVDPNDDEPTLNNINRH